MEKRQYTDEELKKFEELTDSLIQWMFHKPNDRYPITLTIKEAFLFGLSQSKRLKK